MDIRFKTRQFYPDELRILKTLKSQKEKQLSSKMKFYPYAVAAILGAVCTYIATAIPDSFWTFLFGTMAVLSFGYIVFMPWETHNQKKKHKDFLRQLDAFIDKGTVDTCVIHAKRVVLVKEYEDEGDFYVIEYDTDKLLYLWDNEYNLQKKFPCLDFEIYEDKFYKIFGRQIYSLSDRIKPLIIDKKAKRNFMTKVGAPGHLETENKNLDRLIEEYNTHA